MDECVEGPSWLDGAPVSATVCDWRKHDRGHVVYILNVERAYGRSPRRWAVERRYSDFCQLQAAVQHDCGVKVPLPQKQYLWNTTPDFVAKRATALQDFLNRLVSHPSLCTSVHVRAFFDSSFDAAAQQDAALCRASMMLRGSSAWRVAKSLPSIGRCLDKHFMLAQSGDSNRRRDIISWYSALSEATILESGNDAGCQDALKALCRLEHPYICAPLFASGQGSRGALVVYPFFDEGSLRDQMYRVRPTDSYLRKYYNAESDSIYPLDTPDLRYVGRHVLEALSFIHKLGIPYGHLHAGNVYVSENGCLLGDVEAGLQGRRSHYWHFAIQLKCISSLEALDVYCFGHTMLELATGDALLTPYIPDDSEMPPCASKIRSLLVTLLSESAVRGTHYPTVKQLLSMELFAGVAAMRLSATQVAISRPVSEAFAGAREAMLKQLLEHRKQMREVERSSRLAAFLSSDAHRVQRRRMLQEWSLGIVRGKDTDLKTVEVLQSSSSGLTCEKAIDGDSLNSSTVSNNPSETSASPKADKIATIIETKSRESVKVPCEFVKREEAITKSPVNERSALLASIRAFSKDKLKHSQVNDRSCPKL